MNEDEPYWGVSSLFNGDLALAGPYWADRSHWVIVPLADRLALGYCPNDHRAHL